MPLRLYRATTDEDAALILARGFRDDADAHGLVGLDETFRGVWLSYVPFNVSDGDTLLEVMLDMTEEELSRYGVIGDHEDWVIPAAVVNSRGKVRLVPDEERMSMGYMPRMLESPNDLRGPERN